MTPLENIEAWRQRVTQAAIGMEARWTERRLVEVDLDLARLLVEQRNLFREACNGGKPGEVARHGAAMCRGYAAAVKALEDAPLPIEDAYQFGYDPQTNTHVAIGVGKAPAQRVAEIDPRTIYLTYDEVAALLGRVAALKPLLAAKRQWPGCEILDASVGEQPINQFDQPIPADDVLEDDL